MQQTACDLKSSNEFGLVEFQFAVIGFNNFICVMRLRHPLHLRAQNNNFNQEFRVAIKSAHKHSKTGTIRLGYFGTARFLVYNKAGRLEQETGEGSAEFLHLTF